MRLCFEGVSDEVDESDSPSSVSSSAIETDEVHRCDTEAGGRFESVKISAPWSDCPMKCDLRTLCVYFFKVGPSV